MKLFCTLAFTLAIGLAGCGPAPKGVGFTGVGSEPTAGRATLQTVPDVSFRPSPNELVTRRTNANGSTTETYTYGGSRTWRASELSYQPKYRGRVPTVSVSSPRLKQTGQPLRGEKAINAVAWSQAAGIQGVPVELGGVRGQLRHVKFDGQDYGVVAHVKTDKPSPDWKWSGVEAKLSRIAMSELSCTAPSNMEGKKIDKGFIFVFVLPLSCG